MKQSKFLKLLSAMLAVITVMSVVSLPTYAKTESAPQAVVSVGEQAAIKTLGAGPSYRPIFTTAAGTYEQSVEVGISKRPGVTVYYTYNGKTPTTSSKKYTAPFKITKSCTVKAIAVYNGQTSGVAAAEYVIKVKKPSFYVTGGYYEKAQSVILTGMDAKTVIYYTTDGSKPTTKSKKYNGPIKVTDYAIISARAYRSGCTKSDIVTHEYKIYGGGSNQGGGGSTSTDERKTTHYEWNDGLNDWTFDTNLRVVDYKTYYKKQNYTSKGFQYAKYVTDATDDNWVKKVLVDQFMKAADQEGYTKLQKLYMVISFVQHITYKTDKESTGKAEFPKYPLVTVYEGNGDCEDTAILLTSMLKAMGYDCVLIEYAGTATEEGHMAVGIAGDFSGACYTYQGKKYFYVETTNTGWDIGEVPDGYYRDASIHSLK